MSNSPTLPPVAGSQRKPTPLPALAAASDARVHAALAANARTEASLASLLRAIQQLGNGVGGAREANESLTLELEGLRDLLGAAGERQQILERKLAQLESVLDRARKEHAQERAFLIDQQDLFLIKLLDEQELELRQRDAALETLRGRLEELGHRSPASLPPPLVHVPGVAPAAVTLLELDAPAESTLSELDRAERAELERTAQKLAEDRERAREAVARLQAQRDEAQGAVARIGKERDDALHEIHRLRSELGGPRTTRPPASEARHDSSSSARAQATLRSPDQLEADALFGRPILPTNVPTSAPSASSPIASLASDSRKAYPITSVLSPPRGNPNTPSPFPARLSPPPARLSPPPSPQNSLPPEELRRALTGDSSSLQPAPDSRSALKQKPDASTRPLVGYSLGTDSIEPERLEAAAQLSPGPPGSKR